MDGEFACPECGGTVQVRGLAPGRQVRCGFCNQLLEVPYLPRTEQGWRPLRRSRLRWVPWAWWGIAVVTLALLGFGGMKLILRGERAGRVRSIQEMLAASEAESAAGRFGPALVKLDSALSLLPAVGKVDFADPGSLRERRQELARNDVHALLGRLEGVPDVPRSAGEWLNLLARTGNDSDLLALRGEVEKKFRDAVDGWVVGEEARARSEIEEWHSFAALERCQASADLSSHLSPTLREPILRRLDAVVLPLIESRGAMVEITAAPTTLGKPEGWAREATPILRQTLASKGFVPYIPTSQWKKEWTRAPFRATVAIRERFEGNYMSSLNRMTRLDADVVLAGPGREIFKTNPAVKTHSPLSSLPSYWSSRLALREAREADAEKILYDDARTRMIERLKVSVLDIPSCRDLAR